MRKDIAHDPGKGFNRIRFHSGWHNRNIINRINHGNLSNNEICSARREFDRELQDTFELIIYAHDNGTPQLDDKTVITINLGDVNDNVPMFRSPTYQKTLSESDPRGTVVFTLSDKVKDDDYGINGEFSFTLVDNADGRFRLVNNEIILDRMLDIDGETANSDEFTLEVRGEPIQFKVHYFES